MRGLEIQKKIPMAINPKLYGILGIQRTAERIGLRRRDAPSIVIEKKGTLHICHQTQARSFLLQKQAWIKCGQRGRKEEPDISVTHSR